MDNLSGAWKGHRLGATHLSFNPTSAIYLLQGLQQFVYSFRTCFLVFKRDRYTSYRVVVAIIN